MHERVLERLELQAELQQAIELEQFEVHYQPVVRLDGHHPNHGVEALLRWNHPQRGVVPPLQFIPLAEETGLIVPIGAWVLREACRQGAILHQSFPRPEALTISVNLSAKQLQAESIVRDVEAALAESGLEPSSLILEITETVMMSDAEIAIVRLNDLKALGVRIALDDFGTGYSSLSYLSRFPVDILKMDRSFLSGGGESSLVAAVIAIGDRLGLEVVAEGIEREEQSDSLRDLGCQLGQGFLFARPMTRGCADAVPARGGACAARVRRERAPLECNIATKRSTALGLLSCRAPEAAAPSRLPAALVGDDGLARGRRHLSHRDGLGGVRALERARGALRARDRDDRADDRVPPARRGDQRSLRPASHPAVQRPRARARSSACSPPCCSSVRCRSLCSSFSSRSTASARPSSRRRSRRSSRTSFRRPTSPAANALDQFVGRWRSGWSARHSAACSSRCSERGRRSRSTRRRSQRRRRSFSRAKHAAGRARTRRPRTCRRSRDGFRFVRQQRLAVGHTRVGGDRVSRVPRPDRGAPSVSGQERAPRIGGRSRSRLRRRRSRRGRSGSSDGAARPSEARRHRDVRVLDARDACRRRLRSCAFDGRADARLPALQRTRGGRDDHLGDDQAGSRARARSSVASPASTG